MGAMDELIDASALERLRNQLRTASDTAFPAVARAATEVDGLKLRQRVDLVAAALIDDLPSVYGDAATIVRSALSDPEFSGWTIWPVGEAMTVLALASEIGTVHSGRRSSSGTRIAHGRYERVPSLASRRTCGSSCSGHLPTTASERSRSRTRNGRMANSAVE